VIDCHASITGTRNGKSSHKYLFVFLAYLLFQVSLPRQRIMVIKFGDEDIMPR